MVRLRRRSRLPISIQRDLVAHFVAGTPTGLAAELVGVNRNTAILYFQKLRETIAERFTAEAPSLASEVEVDESYLVPLVHGFQNPR